MPPRLPGSISRRTVGNDIPARDWHVAWKSDFALAAVAALGRWHFVFWSRSADVKQACVFDGLGIGASLPVFKALAPTGKVGDVGDLLRDVAHNVINTPDGVFWPMECARPFCANELNWAWGRLTSACATLGRGKAVLMLNLWRLDMTYLGKTPGEGIVSDRIGFDLSGVSVTGKMEFAEPEV